LNYYYFAISCLQAKKPRKSKKRTKFMKKNTPKRLKTERTASGKWLALNKINYSDAFEKERTWESVERLNCDGATVMIAKLKPSERLLLIRQYRPPVDSYVIEFPAGLIDPGESPETTAQRELMEETGYSGKLIKLYEQSFNSPGLTNESIQIAIMEIDEVLPENTDVSPQMEESEDIETMLVPLKDLSDFLDKAQKKGDFLDSKLLAFAISVDFFQCQV
jgi:ADP-ribose pyrophosphatase